MIATIEHHDLVLLGTTEELFFRALGYTFYHHFEHLAHILGIAFGRELVLEFDDFIQATDFDFFRDVFRLVLGSVCSRSFRILEHEGRGIATFTHQRKRFLMVFFRF